MSADIDFDDVEPSGYRNVALSIDVGSVVFKDESQIGREKYPVLCQSEEKGSFIFKVK